MYRRDDEKLHCRDGEQAEHFSASQGAEQARLTVLTRFRERAIRSYRTIDTFDESSRTMNKSDWAECPFANPREKLCGRVMNPKRGHLPNQIIANSEEIDSSSELSDAVPGRAEVR